MAGFSRNMAIFALCCAAITLASPFFGMSVISPLALLEGGSPDAEVFWRLRLPRAVASFLAGAGLAVSGAAFQALFRNPLATPFTLGVSSGAAFGASVYFRFGAAVSLLGSFGSLGAALAGGFLSMAFVYAATRARGGVSTPVMLLAGVVVNFFFSSLVLFLQYWSNAGDSLRIMRWLMGSLSGLDAARLADLSFIVLAGSAAVFRLSRELDLLTAGDELAASRGVAVARTKMALFCFASVMVGAVVSLTGPIGFVGMMVPHLCRLRLGGSHRRLLPASFMLGGTFLVACDLLARSLLAPAEIPVGVITALMGAPFFLWILLRTKALQL